MRPRLTFLFTFFSPEQTKRRAACFPGSFPEPYECPFAIMITERLRGSLPCSEKPSSQKVEGWGIFTQARRVDASCRLFERA